MYAKNYAQHRVSSKNTTLAVGEGLDDQRDDYPQFDHFEVADVEFRHSIQRIETDERQGLIECRACGRMGAPGEISAYEFCPGNERARGRATASMLGIPSGGQR